MRRRGRIREGLQKDVSIRSSEHHALVFLENPPCTLVCEIACRQSRHRCCPFDEFANGWRHTEFHSFRLALACATLLRSRSHDAVSVRRSAVHVNRLGTTHFERLSPPLYSTILPSRLRNCVAGTLTVARSLDAETTKGGRTVTLPIPDPLRPYLEATVRWSPSEWLFPKPDGTQRSLDLDVTAVLRRALGRAGIVEGYEHRCRKARCGHVERAPDNTQRRCPRDGHALWLRPLPRRL